MQKEIKNDTRLVKMGDLPAVRELKAYVNELDAKYGVDSSDKENSFGIIDLDYHLVSALCESNLYFFLYGYSGKIDYLPKYQDVLIPMDTMLRAGEHWGGKRPLELEPYEKDKLIRLREEARDAIKAAYPKCAHRMEGISLVESLRRQGFADPLTAFSCKFMVRDENGVRKPFEVEYKYINGNRAPYFSTTYDGWQNQEEMSQDELAYQFYQKWNVLHMVELTLEEYAEMKADVEELKKHYL